MHKFLPTFVIAFLILLILSVSTANSFAKQRNSTKVLSSKTARVKATAKKPQKTQVVKPTYTSTKTPSATPTPPPKADPSQAETPTKAPENPVASAPGLSEEQKFMIQAINDYRASQGLSSVSPDANTCNFAATRAQEIVSNFSHDGFRQRIDNKTLPYPSYSLVTENIAETPDYKAVVQMWINSPGHAENMRKDTPFVCVVKNDKYYAYEGLKL